MEDLLQMTKPKSFNATTAKMQYILFHLSYSEFWQILIIHPKPTHIFNYLFVSKADMIAHYRIQSILILLLLSKTQFPLPCV